MCGQFISFELDVVLNGSFIVSYGTVFQDFRVGSEEDHRNARYLRRDLSIFFSGSLLPDIFRADIHHRTFQIHGSVIVFPFEVTNVLRSSVEYSHNPVEFRTIY